jgi:uncharacterized protein (TIGR00369 family)
MTNHSSPPPAVNDERLLGHYRALSETASFNRWAGLEVLFMSEGRCELRLQWRPEEMGQYSGFLHAGVIAALLDTACGFAADAASGGVLTSHFSVNCLAPAVGSEFRAIGSVVRAGRKQIFTTGELRAVGDSGSKLVATAEVILVPGA